MQLEVKLILFFIIGILSCNQKHIQKVGVGDYITYFENKENGLCKEIEVGECAYTFQFKNAQYIVAKQKVQGLQGDSLVQRMHRLKESIWFNIQLSNHKRTESLLRYKAAGLDEYNWRLNYFLQEAEQHFYAEMNGKALKRVGYYFENNYGLTPIDLMVVGFALPTGEAMQGDIHCSYEDKLFNNGTLNVVIKKKDIEKIPELQLKKI